jgi:hypothetical protein
MTGKKRAIPSSHRDSFLAKVRGFNPDASSGNATSLYCRAVKGNCAKKILFFVGKLMSLSGDTGFV